MANSNIEKLIDAGMQFTEMSKKQAEVFVSKLVKAGDVQRQEAERISQALVERGRETSDRLRSMVQAEVSREVAWLNDRYEELEEQFEALADKVGEVVPGVAGSANNRRKRTAKKSTAKKSAAKKSAAKKSAAKKSAAKKSAAKKSPAKKSASKKAAPKKRAAKKSAAVGSSGVRKVSASRDA
jgi:polyhydroxyalkanoate synthesis regulator phasin